MGVLCTAFPRWQQVHTPWVTLSYKRRYAAGCHYGCTEDKPDSWPLERKITKIVAGGWGVGLWAGHGPSTPMPSESTTPGGYRHCPRRAGSAYSWEQPGRAPQNCSSFIYFAWLSEADHICCTWNLLCWRCTNPQHFLPFGTEEAAFL